MPKSNSTLDETTSVPPKAQANAAPLGLSSFAMTLFVFSMYLIGTGGVVNHNVALGLALFYGGFIQVLAGIFEMMRGDIFHGTIFPSFGGYWICFGFINYDATGILSSYKDNPEMLRNALGIFLVGWTIFAFIMLLCALKSNLVLITILSLLVIINTLLTTATFTGLKSFEVAGGVFGVIAAFCAWYLALALILQKESSYFTLKTWPIERIHTLSTDKV
ncbi:putative transmembrane protein [Rhizophagus irregularis DAOM 181602=DAOM 197198]|nr:putative transmembrane protein [Rhizophagus irregularis DAOM 181602=DAOM 197198]CAG8668693.1 5267_t:CDS:2 [Rhizophagus irregularis]